MRFVYSYSSLKSLRIFLKEPSPITRVCFNRGFHYRGAVALRQSESSSATNIKSSRDDALRKQQEGERKKDDYYALLLSSPLRAPTSTENSIGTTVPLSVSSLTPISSVAETPVSVLTSPRIVFGSRLAGPAAREQEGWGERRPQEPDNCCISGCVNCVWDTFREEVEEWSARQRRRQKQAQDGGQGLTEGREVDKASKIRSIDGDGVGDVDGMGGTNLDPNAFFKDLPVGIKEFIALEKRLKEHKSP